MSTPRAARRHQHSPRVRQRAREHDVDLLAIMGTGVRGRVTPADVDAAAQTPPTARPTTFVPDTLGFVEIDLTLRFGHHRSWTATDVLAAVGQASLVAIRSTHPIEILEVRTATSTTVHRAHDLTVEALRRRISAGASSPTTTDRRVVVIEAGGPADIMVVHSPGRGSRHRDRGGGS